MTSREWPVAAGTYGLEYSAVAQNCVGSHFLILSTFNSLPLHPSGDKARIVAESP